MSNNYKATVYGKTIEAPTLKSLKYKASIVANFLFKSVDDMYLELNGNKIHFIRINKKSPDGRIVRGQWR